MAHLPDGVKFILTSKTQGAQKDTVEQEFIADAANGYPEGQANADAVAAFQLLFGAHTGGTKVYSMFRCEEYGHEVRPIPE